MNKSELLDWMQEEYQQWESLLEQIDPAHMDQPGVNGEWSMKDIVAHQWGWLPRLITRIEAAQRGEAEPPPPWPAHLQPDDAVNAWIYETNHGRSVQEVLGDSDRVFQQLLTVIKGLPNDVRIESEGHLVWLNGQRFAVGEFFDHFHDDHEADVRAWMARVKKQ